MTGSTVDLQIFLLLVVVLPPEPRSTPHLLRLTTDLQTTSDNKEELITKGLACAINYIECRI